MPTLPDQIATAELRGYAQAMNIVALALREALAEPRPVSRGTTERGGRICALGSVLATLALQGPGGASDANSE